MELKLLTLDPVAMNMKEVRYNYSRSEPSFIFQYIHTFKVDFIVHQK